MKRSLLLWFLALVITLASAVYQRLTGPTHPLRGRTQVGGLDLRYRLLRSHGGESDHRVRIETGDTGVAGVLYWKRHKTADEFRAVPMVFENGGLQAYLPHQPPAGKLNYRIVLRRAGSETTIPAGEPVTIRFKGDVPVWILVLHVAAMFGGMLVSNRAGLEALWRRRQMQGLAVWALLLLAAGGMVLGPVVQKYAFGAYWTGWPFGHDLTDNKTAVALLAWAGAWVAVRRGRGGRGWVLAAGLVTLAIYIIPHSLLGSELDYGKTSPAAAP